MFRAIEQPTLLCPNCFARLSSQVLRPAADVEHVVTCTVCGADVMAMSFRRQPADDPQQFPWMTFMSTLCGFACGALVALLAVYVAWRG